MISFDFVRPNNVKLGTIKYFFFKRREVVYIIEEECEMFIVKIDGIKTGRIDEKSCYSWNVVPFRNGRLYVIKFCLPLSNMKRN